MTIRHIKKSHIYPVIKELFGSKYNQLAEVSEVANETAASIK
jgi:hypothetical protein